MARAAANLIYASGETSLRYLFEPEPQYSAKHYIQKAFALPEGQFGYANHWCIEQAGKPLAIATCWHTQLTKVFHQATLDSLQRYYPTAALLQILQRSQIITAVLSPPASHQLCIGHFAVDNEYKRQGLGNKMLAFLKQRAQALNKGELILDVAQSNGAAIAFYQQAGFRFSSDKCETVMGCEPHFRMTLALSNRSYRESQLSDSNPE